MRFRRRPREPAAHWRADREPRSFLQGVQDDVRRRDERRHQRHGRIEKRDEATKDLLQGRERRARKRDGAQDGEQRIDRGPEEVHPRQICGRRHQRGVVHDHGAIRVRGEVEHPRLDRGLAVGCRVRRRLELHLVVHGAPEVYGRQRAEHQDEREDCPEHQRLSVLVALQAAQEQHHGAAQRRNGFDCIRIV